jgi:hypothetical protein
MAFVASLPLGVQCMNSTFFTYTVFDAMYGTFTARMYLYIPYMVGPRFPCWFPATGCVQNIW